MSSVPVFPKPRQLFNFFPSFRHNGGEKDNTEKAKTPTPRGLNHPGFLATYQDNLQHELKSRLHRLKALFVAFEELSGEYETLDGTLVADSLKLRAKVEEQYLRVQGGLLCKLTNDHNHVKFLVVIELPHFNGDLTRYSNCST